MGRCIGPFLKAILEELIGPCQSSPFSIIPKATIAKYCILQNCSPSLKPITRYPNQSINSYINSDNIPTTWGTFSLFSLLLSHLPPSSQLATKDVSEAYQGCTLNPSQWLGAVVRLSKVKFSVNTALCFGSSPCASTYGSI